MLPSQVELIQSSFAKVAPISEAAAGLFYGRLFEIAPEVKPLFKGDMSEQGRKLMATLAVVVKGLSNLDAVVPAAQVLAKRHVAYGVTEAHYAPVGAALLWTLEQGLGDAFTPEVKAAWAEAYGLLASVMIAAAAETVPAPAAAE
ncbi:MAG: hemin receptor [Rhizobiales bacterium]|nr:hemin receptor [Hyphomicrobiales bacterium]